MRIRLLLLVPILLAGVLALDLAPAAALTTHTVTTTDDVVDGGDGLLSLREAFTLANTDGDDSVITLALSATYALTLCDAGSPQEQANASGDLNLVANDGLVTMNGGGSTVDQTCAAERVIESRADLTVNDTTVSGGDLASVADGGGISAGTLALVDSTVTGNTAILGGGVQSTLLTLLRSAVRGNSAGTAGGISVISSGTLTATDSSVTGNDAVANRAGVHLESTGSSALLTNTTVGGNTTTSDASAVGSQLDSSGAVTLVHATIVGVDAGAALRAGTSLTTFGAVVDQAGGFAACAPSNQGPTTSLGYNVVTDASCALAGVTDEEEVTDVGLGALGPYGGVGQAYTPEVNGLLEDLIPAADCDPTVAADAQGTDRPQGPGCEPGALELIPDQLIDALIRNSSQAAFGGDGIINLTGSGQSRLQIKARGQKANFFVRFENNGLGVDHILVRGPGSGSGFTVRYFAGPTPITAAVVAGTHRFDDVAPGATRTIRVEVTVGRGPAGATRNVLVKGTSFVEPSVRDVVKASVRRRNP